MGRAVAIYGFETGSLSAEGSWYLGLENTVQGTAVGNATLESSIVRTGVGSLKVVPASGAQGYWHPSAGIAGFFVSFIRFYIRVTARPATTARMIFGDTTAGNILLNTSGTLTLRNLSSSLGTSTTALTDTTKWYRIEVQFNGTTAKLYIDGVQEVSAANSQNSMPAQFGATDTVADTYTAYFDDIIYDDAGLPGAGQAALLVPISDNARDTLWTAGVGGTTNLFAAVDNKPPIGTATETDLTQIEHAGGAAGTTDRYDANMTTYLAAGIGIYDEINAVQSLIVSGEDSATGDKLLKFQILSNPVGTATANFNVAGTSGALGTFPTGWWVTRSPVDSNPSVTTGTSPVMRVVRPETASRVASVCFMGIYVDYTPMGEKSLNINQSVKRASFF